MDRIINPNCRPTNLGEPWRSMSRPTPIRNTALENRKRFSTVLPPVAMVSPPSVAVGAMASAHV